MGLPAALFRPKDISSVGDCSDLDNCLVGENTVTTFTRTTVRFPIARFLVLAGIVTVAGCGSYDDSQQASETTPVADSQAVADAKPASELPTQIAAAPPARKLPAAAMLAETEAEARSAIREAGLADTTATRTPTTPPVIAESTLSVEPTRLSLGTIATGKFARGTVLITNTGSEPITINQCKTSCGCTSTKCPKGETLSPGQVEEVEIQITAGTRARQINKTVTFNVDGQRPVTLPVSVEVIAYVTLNPQTIDPDVNADGKLVLTATDGQPFRIISMNPPVIEEFEDIEATEHEVYVSWDRWRELGQNRRLTINVDHPEVEQVAALVRTRPQTARNVADSPLKGTATSLRNSGVVDTPLLNPSPAQTLAVAVKYGKVDEISEALGTGIDQENRDALLNLASRYGQVEVIDLLLANGASVESKDKLGRTAVLSAVQSRNTEAVVMLLAKGADVNARDSQQGTALQRAAGSFGNQAMVEALIKAGADVDAADKNGQTPLMWAARWGDSERVQALVNGGATVDLRDSKGMSALDYARNRRDKDLTQKNKVLEIIQPVAESKVDSGSTGEPGVD